MYLQLFKVFIAQIRLHANIFLACCQEKPSFVPPVIIGARPHMYTRTFLYSVLIQCLGGGDLTLSIWAALCPPSGSDCTPLWRLAVNILTISVGVCFTALDAVFLEGQMS